MNIDDIKIPQSKIDYANSDKLEAEEVLLYITTGLRKPKNDHEKRLLKQIEEIEDKGFVVDIPSN